MKALVVERYGGPEVLAVLPVPEPQLKASDKLVHVRAGGVNFADILSAKGKYPATPLPPMVAGREFAGELVGAGERVMGYAQWGAFAERVAAHEGLLWHVPETWTFEEAAAFPVNYFTAYFAYWKAGLLEKPEGQSPRVLIHAVAGGVGTAAVQIGKLLGVEMYGTSSSDEKLARVNELGLQHGINYKQVDYVEAVKNLTAGEGVDAVFEMLGGDHLAKGVECLRDFGRVIVYGAATGKAATFDPRILYAKGASVHGLWLTYLSLKPALMRSAWLQLSAWVKQGHLRPIVGHVLPFENAAEAYRLLMDRGNVGKVVLRIG